MGIWAHGTFENDTAHGFLSDLVRQLAGAIESDLASARRERRPTLERPTLAAVACLRAMGQRLDDAAALVSPEQVDKWEREYLEWFDDKFVSSTTKADAAPFRTNAVSEFRRLKAAAKRID